MKKYEVLYYGDDSWQVWNTVEERSEYIGTLSDCEVWIRLKNKGYIK